MSLMVVGIADCRISSEPGSVLVTYALGSCVAVSVHDPVAGIGGLLHYMLPEGSLDEDKARANPYMFADTGIHLLLKRLGENGAERRRLIVQLSGGAQVLDEQGLFNIGKRNALAARKALWKEGVIVQAEVLGGSVYRTVRLEVGDGNFWVREGAAAERLLCGKRQSATGRAMGKEVRQWQSVF